MQQESLTEVNLSGARIIQEQLLRSMSQTNQLSKNRSQRNSLQIKTKCKVILRPKLNLSLSLVGMNTVRFKLVQPCLLMQSKRKKKYQFSSPVQVPKILIVILKYQSRIRKNFRTKIELVLLTYKVLLLRPKSKMHLF